MKLHMKVNISIYFMLYAYLLVRMLFSRFAIDSTIWDAFLFAISFFYLISYCLGCNKGKAVVVEFVLCSILLIMITGMNIVFTKEGNYWAENVIVLEKNNYILFILISMVVIKKERFISYIDSSFFFLNVFGIVNLVVVSLQEVFHGFLMRPEHLASNSYYPDLCAGFFGYNGTHRLTYFYCFLVIYDIYIYYCISKFRRKSYLAFIALLIIWSIIVSRGNENPSFILFLLIDVLLLYTNISYYVIGKRSFAFLRKLLYPAAGLLLLMYAYSINVTGGSGGSLIKKISLAMHSTTNMAKGSSERIGIIVNAFKDGVAFKMGYGIGMNKWTGSGSHFMGFQHFGLSSASSFIALGGIMYFLIVCFIIWRWQSSVFTLKHKSTYKLSIATVLLLSTLYTDILTNDLTLFWLTMNAIVLSMCLERIIERKNTHVLPFDKRYYSVVQCKSDLL